ncbi:uncharacterized protein LOC144304722 [Canis aureus]
MTCNLWGRGSYCTYARDVRQEGIGNDGPGSCGGATGAVGEGGPHACRHDDRDCEASSVTAALGRRRSLTGADTASKSLFICHTTGMPVLGLTRWLAGPILPSVSEKRGLSHIKYTYV